MNGAIGKKQFKRKFIISTSTEIKTFSVIKLQQKRKLNLIPYQLIYPLIHFFVCRNISVDAKTRLNLVDSEDWRRFEVLSSKFYKRHWTEFYQQLSVCSAWVNLSEK